MNSKISNGYNNDLLTNEWVKKSEIMRQDLKLFKELKQVWTKEEWCQGVPLSADSLKSLFNYNEELFNKNLELDKKVIELEKENQELKEKYEILDRGYNSCHLDYEDVKGENEKLTNAIEVLKKFNFKLGQYGSGEYYILIYYASIAIEIILTQQEYGLLNEVLENDK